MLSFDETSTTRRFVMQNAAVSALALLNLNCGLMLLPAMAEENAKEEGENEGLVGALQSLFDPNEKTKSGKILPKAYLKSAREVVKTLRESLQEDTKDMAKFRRTADAAKESIREYLGGWRGQKEVINEASFFWFKFTFRNMLYYPIYFSDIILILDNLACLEMEECRENIVQFSQVEGFTFRAVCI